MKEDQLTSSGRQPIIDDDVNPSPETPKPEMEDAWMFGVLLPVLVFNVNYNLKCEFTDKKTAEDLKC
jgi:hypothetical protein